MARGTCLAPEQVPGEWLAGRLPRGCLINRVAPIPAHRGLPVDDRGPH